MLTLFGVQQLEIKVNHVKAAGRTSAAVCCAVMPKTTSGENTE